MSLGRKKGRALCMVMMINIFICVLVGVSWRHDNKDNSKRVRIPTQRFWRQQIRSESFWNKEQERLDVINNPLINSELLRDSLTSLPDWLTDTGPKDQCEADYRVPRQILDYNTLPKRFQDFLLHMRCRMYPMLLNQPHVCDENPFLLLVVKSLIPHFDR